MLSKRADKPGPRGYILRVAGALGEDWAEWFDGLAVTTDAKGHTVLTGVVADQAALYGLLARLRDLGLPLLSVNPIDGD
jgi:hypothetical protein